jgi:hypothetical protein
MSDSPRCFYLSNFISFLRDWNPDNLWVPRAKDVKPGTHQTFARLLGERVHDPPSL